MPPQGLWAGRGDGPAWPSGVCLEAGKSYSAQLMKLLITIFPALFAFAFAAPAQEMKKFISEITNSTWDLRGTANLKRIRFDGETFYSVSKDGEALGALTHSMIDPGVFRFDYGKSRASWYLVNDDLKYIMSANVIQEVTFKPEGSAKPRAVKDFPQDIKGVVWEGERDHLPAKLRWNGTTIEVGVKDPHWQVNFVLPITASRRMFEFKPDHKTTVWLVFAADGGTAWWLTITDVYGGHTPGLQTAEIQMPGLHTQQNDLANHAEDLFKTDRPVNAATLLREVERKCASNPEVVEQLKARFAPLKR